MSTYDVIVIGGSYAGIGAAMQLGRARKRVLVIDAGKRRNRFAGHSHGFLGQDGVAPDVIAAKGKAEVLAYPTVQWREALVTNAKSEGGGFVVNVGEEPIAAKRIILATGVTDELPAIPGLRDHWGTHVFQCPYCHGYELNRGKLGVLATSPNSLHHAAMVTEWSHPGGVTFFLDECFDLDAEQATELASRGVHVERQKVIGASVEGSDLVLRLRDGRDAVIAGLFLLPKTHVNAALADQLGCALENGPTGTYFKTDPTKETTVPGVFACGDGALPFGAVALAVADGVMAGSATHRSLIFRR